MIHLPTTFPFLKVLDIVKILGISLLADHGSKMRWKISLICHKDGELEKRSESVLTNSQRARKLYFHLNFAYR
jgi:hypothetical protein